MKKFFFGILFLLSAAGPLLGLLGRWHWTFDLFSHFRAQFTALVFPTVFFFLFFKQFKKALCLSFIFILCAVSLAPYFIPKKTFPHISDLTVFYANVYTANQNYEKVIRLIQETNPDIVVLLEIDERWKNHLQAFMKDFKIQKLAVREDNFGIGVYSKIPMEAEIQYLAQAQVPSIKGTFVLKGRNTTLWATHPLPPAGPRGWSLRNEQLQNLGKLISTETNPVLLVGDLNTSPWSYWFRFATTNGRLHESRKGFGLQLSWPTLWPWFLRVPIDHLLHSKEFHIVEHRLLPSIGSDHLPFSAKIHFIADRLN